MKSRRLCLRTQLPVIHESACLEARFNHVPLLEEPPKQVVRDRVDASERVLDRFYDKRNRFEKMENRRDYLPDE